MKIPEILSPSKIKMEAAREFVVSGELMESALGRIMEGYPTPPQPFHRYYC